jgi:hypothetical protein
MPYLTTARNQHDQGHSHAPTRLSSSSHRSTTRPALSLVRQDQHRLYFQLHSPLKFSLMFSFCLIRAPQGGLPFRASWCHQEFDSGVALDWVFYPFCFLDLSNEALNVRFDRRARELGGLFRPSRRGCSGNGRREPCHAGLMSLISTAPGADAADDGPAVGAAGSARHWACMTTMATVVTRAVHRVLWLPPDLLATMGTREQGSRAGRHVIRPSRRPEKPYSLVTYLRPIPSATSRPSVEDGNRHMIIEADDRRARLNQRLRQAFISGAEEDSRRRLGRGLTAEELERVLRHYPGDIAKPR